MGVKKEYLIDDPRALDELAEEWINRWNTPKIVLLYGELGSGKTTLVRAFANVLGVRDEVTSPTFSLIQEYHGSEESLYHVDLYRLDDPEELIVEIGLHELLDGGQWIFIEWPDLIEDLVDPHRTKRIKLEHRGQNARKIIVLEDEFEGETR